MKLLDGKTAIITGAGRGIGKEIARVFLEQGARLVLNDLEQEPLSETIEELKRENTQVVGIAGSIIKEEVTNAIVKLAMDTYGGIDIIVNNAGHTWDAVIQKTSDEMWYKMIDLHATAPFRLLRAAQPFLRDAAKKEKAEGIIVNRKVVNISSLSGVTGGAGQVNYAASKAAIIGLTKSLAKEWGHLNINVNCLAFGWIDTRLTQEKAKTIIDNHEVAIGVPKTMTDDLKKLIPLGRSGTTLDAAYPVLFLSSLYSDFISGQVLVVDGGLSCN